MGDPRKLRKKYESPKKVWNKERLISENKLISTYGLKNMRELWRMSLIIKKIRREVRKLFSIEDAVAEARGRKIIERLYALGIVEKDAKIEELLSLGVEDILKRRLQTLVLVNGLALNTSMSRQLICHGFIAVDGKKATKPSMLVKRDAAVTALKPIPEYSRNVVKGKSNSNPEAPSAQAAEKPRDAQSAASAVA